MIIKDTDKALFMLDQNCRKLEHGYYIILGVLKENDWAEYILINKENETVPVYTSQFIEMVLTKYNTIITLKEQDV